MFFTSQIYRTSLRTIPTAIVALVMTVESHSWFTGSVLACISSIDSGLPYKEKAVEQSQVLVRNWRLLEFDAPFSLCAPVIVQKVYFQAIFSRRNRLSYNYLTLGDKKVLGGPLIQKIFV